MNLELVVFDMAGTTVEDDDAVAHALQAALRSGGVELELDAINAVMGWPKPVAIRTLLERARKPPAPGVVAALHQAFERRMVEHYRNDPGVREVTGASSTFRWLKGRGIKVALDTGFSRPIVDAILARLDWTARGLIDATVASDEVPRGRPHPDLIFVAMERTHVHDVRRVAKVGDTPADLQQGTAAGCGLVIGVTAGTHTREQLAPHPCSYLVKSVDDLPELFRTQLRSVA